MSRRPAQIADVPFRVPQRSIFKMPLPEKAIRVPYPLSNTLRASSAHFADARVAAFRSKLSYCACFCDGRSLTSLSRSLCLQESHGGALWTLFKVCWRRWPLIAWR